MQKLLLSFLVVVLFMQCKRAELSPESAKLAEANISKAAIKPINAVYDAFGVNINNFDVQSYNVQKNESLYLLLEKLNLSQSEIYHAIQKAKKIIDVRSFRPQQNYRAYMSKDGSELRKMVWQPNQVEFVTFDWQQDSLQIYRASRAVSKKTSRVSGQITSSLYNAISDAESRDELVYRMSEIFAWQVDFFNLRKGDSFNILYEKKYVDGQYIDTGRILAVELTHMGDRYYAYRFNAGPFDGYYDDEGKSVQKALLKAPFKYDHRISSGFNPNRFHPVLKRRRPHNGIDYAAPYGTPVLSVGDGTVSRAGYYGSAGRMVEVKYHGSFKAKYMHLSRFASGIRSGKHVKQGEVIGYVGNTGRVTGTHLHYGLYRHNRPINPLKVDLPAAKSISEEYMGAFEALKTKLDPQLFNQKKDTVRKAATDASVVSTR